MSGISTVASGSPFTLSLNFDNAIIGNTNWPNRLAKGTLDNPTVDRWVDTSAFAFPPQFSTPGATLGTPQFGVIGGTARPNRQMQLGLRLLF